MLGGVESKTVPGPFLQFHCPVCDCQDAVASTYQYGERVAILPGIPLSPYTVTNYLRCEQCRELFVSKVRVFDLLQYEPAELNALLKRRVSFVTISMVILGLLLFAFPLIGLQVNALALVLSWNRRGHWTRTLSCIGMVLAVATTLACAGLVVIGGNN